MPLFLHSRLFVSIGVLVFLFVVAYFLPEVLPLAKVGAAALAAALVVDLTLLFGGGGEGVEAERLAPDRLSNGDDNELALRITNRRAFTAALRVIDELPQQFQRRDEVHELKLASGEGRTIAYTVRPVERGEYAFGAINIYVSTPIGLAQRRYVVRAEQTIPVYPSYLQMRRFELMAHTNRLAEIGVKKVRRLGRTLEFDQIREYVSGDDYRTINWRATARRASFMVNQYQDERSQHVFSVIDKGRSMKMPFDGMTLLDHAINASLVISNIVMLKGDKAGLATFAERMGTVVPADRRRSQMQKIMEVLYNQTTTFLEPSYELLYVNLQRHIGTRSLIFLYTNFETISSLHRQLPYLRGIARRHLLVVVFFRNTELGELLEKPAESTEEIYLKAIAEKFDLEKRQIVKELARYGIHSILTTPQELTVDTINKYLEVKARRMI